MENMGIGKIKSKKGLIHKTWDRCRSIGSSSTSSGKRLSRFPSETPSRKPRSWPCTPDLLGTAGTEKPKTKRGTVPGGCFSVYVGSERRRFVIKTTCINHPLFKLLLEEAELVYGYNCEGPLVLPCEVDVFYRVLSEMDDGDEIKQGCTLSRGYGSYKHVSPSRMVAADPF